MTPIFNEEMLKHKFGDLLIDTKLTRHASSTKQLTVSLEVL